RNGIFNYFSRRDSLVLRDVTTRRGTIDRRFSESAGYCGFDPPHDPALSMRLFQFEWNPALRKYGNDGGHMGGLAAPFTRVYVLPLLGTAGTPIPDAGRAQTAAPSTPH